ncbi:MAG: hypothetical protein Rubg2KO_31740 [Rubricoccaceae bacterium]
MFSIPRLHTLLGLALLLSIAACDGSDMEPTGVAQWEGSYTGQSRFGATNGTWGNGGTYALVVSASGQVTVRGALILNPTFDPATNELSWERADGNATNGSITFSQMNDSSFYFSDLGTAGQNFTGFIRVGNDGPLDYRGVLR